ncbi:SCO family protein [uncultured Devosia sp.]|uniref:SCO family protein n=1 Tax=uncultured Devosia sp. TaxID=211434 RepID=UPI0026376DA8|nr:SCO family protein [uncultured Devosia sp.]|tara:strand:+ start:505 stop:1095 length:591 start_codon:yes stop_codon:yes gene_type:complete
MALSHIRTVLWTLVAVAALGATGLYVYTTMTRPAQAVALGQGDYELVTATGAAFNRDSLKGSPSMLFFGFTHCPEVCPTSLAEMASWYEALGDEADDLNAFFVTVDPERDTAEVIGDYVSWTGRVTGVTGSPEEIAKAAQSWAVYAEKVPLEGGDYTMDHTASVFLVNAEGEFEGTIAYREDSDTALAKLRRLLEG